MANPCSFFLDCEEEEMSFWFGGDIGGGGIEYLDGDFDDIGIWNRLLSNAEVEGLYESLTEGCIDATACNFDPEATSDDGSCLYLDECGSAAVLAPFMNVDIPEGDCDCEGTISALGVCGGVFVRRGFRWHM